MTRSLVDWISKLTSSHSTTAAVGMERFDAYLPPLNLLTFDFPIVTVVGTNGKGSVVAGLQTMYLSQGYSVGSYTSPHLFHWEERICVNGEPVSEQLIVSAFERIDAVSTGAWLSLFDYFTLAALFIFKQHN